MAARAGGARARSSTGCRRGSTPSSASAARRCRPASGSGWRRRGRFSRIRRCWSSTSRPRRSIRSRNGSDRRVRNGDARPHDDRDHASAGSGEPGRPRPRAGRIAHCGAGIARANWRLATAATPDSSGCSMRTEVAQSGAAGQGEACALPSSTAAYMPIIRTSGEWRAGSLLTVPDTYPGTSSTGSVTARP